MKLPRWLSRLLTGSGAVTPATGDDAWRDHEPAHTRLRTIDDANLVFAYGGPVPAFDGWRTHEPTRDYLSLDGTWRFRFDPEDDGSAQGWQDPGTDDTTWDTVAVPSCWDLADTPDFGSYDGSRFGEGTAFVDGHGWYRTAVRVPEAWAGRYVRLNFLAVYYRADVWLDGAYLGAHEGGHTPFSLPVDGILRPGQDNTLAVRVFRRASFEEYTGPSAQVTDPRAIPWKPVDHWPYAGITRSVWLEAVPRVTVAKLLTVAGNGRLDALAVVENHSSRPFSGVLLLDPGDGTDGRPAEVPVEVAAGAVRVARGGADIPSVQTWEPTHPVLYTATATLVEDDASDDTSDTAVVERPAIDRLTVRYGSRTVTVGDAKLRVNGAQVFLKGLSWHEESAEHGRSMTREEHDHELGHVRALHANFIRNCVYNRHPYVYDWADEHGVFVMDDIDTMWLDTAQQRLQTEQYGLARALALMMAWNQANHPSVILWCLQNESEIDGGDAPVYRTWLAHMKAAVKGVDPQRRPVTWASSTSNDPAFDLADVVGFNEYFGYFYMRDRDLGPAIDAVHRRYPDKPILITENGTWSRPGRHGSPTEQGTQEWQAASFHLHWDQVVARTAYTAGYTFWVLKDYKTRLDYSRELNGISTMGTVDFDSSTTRLVYGAFRDAANPLG